MKKATVFLLSVCLAALLVGCGGQEKTAGGGAQDETQAATDMKEEAAPGTTSEAETDSGAEKDIPTQQGGETKTDTDSSAGDEKPAVGKTPARENGASAPSKAGPAGAESSDSAGSSSSKPAGNEPSTPAGSGTDAAETPAPQPEEKGLRNPRRRRRWHASPTSIMTGRLVPAIYCTRWQVRIRMLR